MGIGEADYRLVGRGAAKNLGVQVSFADAGHVPVDRNIPACAVREPLEVPRRVIRDSKNELRRLFVKTRREQRPQLAIGCTFLF